MATPVMPGMEINPDPNQFTDRGEGWKLIRTLSAADTSTKAIGYDPGAMDAAAIVAESFRANRAGNVGFRLCMACTTPAAGKQATIEIKVKDADGPDLNAAQDAKTKHKLRTVLKGVCTFSGSTTANKNPVTGDTDTKTWYELSAIDVSSGFIDDSAVILSPNGVITATDFQRIVKIDMDGGERAYIEVSAIDTNCTMVQAGKRVA